MKEKLNEKKKQTLVTARFRNRRREWVRWELYTSLSCIQTPSLLPFDIVQ